jgi:uncharacterized protein YfaS (alpha-2-macroglobulin family)
MKRIIGLLLIFIALCSFIPTNETFVTGHLKSKIGKYSTKHKVILVKYKGNILSSATTDNQGNFNLHFNMSIEDTASVYFYYQNAKDTILLKSMKRFESDTPEITFYIL